MGGEQKAQAGQLLLVLQALVSSWGLEHAKVPHLVWKPAAPTKCMVGAGLMGSGSVRALAMSSQACLRLCTRPSVSACQMGQFHGLSLFVGASLAEVLPMPTNIDIAAEGLKRGICSPLVCHSKPVVVKTVPAVHSQSCQDMRFVLPRNLQILSWLRP